MCVTPLIIYVEFADGADVRALTARQIRGLLPPDLLQRK